MKKLYKLLDEYQAAVKAAANGGMPSSRAAIACQAIRDLFAEVSRSTTALEPFNEAEARAGRPICIFRKGAPVLEEVRFIGMQSEGRVVVEASDKRVEMGGQDEVFMKPREMRTVYLNIYKNGPIYTYAREDLARADARCGATHVACPVQIPAE